MAQVQQPPDTDLLSVRRKLNYDIHYAECAGPWLDARIVLATALKKNDKVLTTAGIIGTVVSISEKEDEVTVRVDENCRLKMLKSSISRNLTQEEAAKKPEEQKAEAAKS